MPAGPTGELQPRAFRGVVLDSQNRLIAYEEMFRGTLTSTVVYPREIVKAALGLPEARETDHFIATGTATVSMAEKGLI